jgi:hypothetical protein
MRCQIKARTWAESEPSGTASVGFVLMINGLPEESHLPS